MNGYQRRKYGAIRTRTTPITRFAYCPFCRYAAQISRHGRNALAASAIVKGQIMTHMRTAHAAELEQWSK